MEAQRAVRVLGAVLALGLIVGCGGGGGGSSNRVSIGGTANYPGSLGGGSVDNADFIIINPDRPSDPLASDVTTDVGRFFGIIRKTISVAVIVSGRVDGQPVRVSGLLAAEENNDDKQLDGQTDIACEAGVQAVIDGEIDGGDLGPRRIANLEDAAARFVTTTDFTDPASVTAAANQVRALTDNGDHPAP
ncbi:MAG: hypothetical protein IT294_06485 [Deltaproteobacteria bacterium]|nr:hypothetical protein [Deltaproteobacteria bacterium]